MKREIHIAGQPENKIGLEKLRVGVLGMGFMGVKNDVLSLRLSGETKDIEKKLIRRYENIRNRVQQMTSADVFQAFVNAVTLSIEPHTTYMSPRSSENFDIGMRLSLQGIGAVLRGKDEYTEVVKTVIAITQCIIDYNVFSCRLYL